MMLQPATNSLPDSAEIEEYIRDMVSMMATMAADNHLRDLEDALLAINGQGRHIKPNQSRSEARSLVRHADRRHFESRK